MGNVYFSVNNHGHGSFPNILTFVIFLAPLSEVNSDNGFVASLLHSSWEFCQQQQQKIYITSVGVTSLHWVPFSFLPPQRLVKCAWQCCELLYWSTLLVPFCIVQKSMSESEIGSRSGRSCHWPLVWSVVSVAISQEKVSLHTTVWQVASYQVFKVTIASDQRRCQTSCHSCLNNKTIE